MKMADDIHTEASDVDIRGILAFGIGLLVVAVVVHFLVWLLFGYFASRESQLAARDFPLAAEQQNRLPPEPRLQTNPKQDLADLRRREEIILNSYGWVDRNTGVVRIPIGEAMKLTVERGLPARQTEK
jgi:hypothetical protein